MTILESQIFSKWLSIILILILIITMFVLSYWYSACRRRNIQKMNKKRPEKLIIVAKPVERILQPTRSLTTKSRSISSSQLTKNDIAYLDKLIRTASDRSMWKRDEFIKEQSNKPRKVPSGHV